MVMMNFNFDWFFPYSIFLLRLNSRLIFNICRFVLRLVFNHFFFFNICHNGYFMMSVMKKEHADKVDKKTKCSDNEDNSRLSYVNRGKEPFDGSEENAETKG